MFLGTLIYGLVNAAILTLYALGFNLTFGVSRIANFAHGALYVLTGFAAWTFLHHLKVPLLVAVAGALILTALLAGLIQRLLLTRLRGLAEAEVIATFGCGLVILESLRYFGFTGPQYTLPTWWDGGLTLGGVFLDGQRALILVFGLALTGGLWLFTRHTRWGLAFRGLAQDEQTAQSFGIDSDLASTLSMSLGGAVCALAAIVVMPLGNIEVSSGYEVLLQALAVCIVGGVGSTWGVILASAILGMAQTFAAMYIGSHWMMIVTLAAILIILVISPSGLLGRQKELEERT